MKLGCPPVPSAFHEDASSVPQAVSIPLRHDMTDLHQTGDPCHIMSCQRSMVFPAARQEGGASWRYLAESFSASANRSTRNLTCPQRLMSAISLAHPIRGMYASVPEGHSAYRSGWKEKKGYRALAFLDGREKCTRDQATYKCARRAWASHLSAHSHTSAAMP